MHAESRCGGVSPVELQMESLTLEELRGTCAWRQGEWGSRASGTLLGLGGGFGHSWLSEPRIGCPGNTWTMLMNNWNKNLPGNTHGSVQLNFLFASYQWKEQFRYTYRLPAIQSIGKVAQWDLPPSSTSPTNTAPHIHLLKQGSPLLLLFGTGPSKNHFQ